MEKNPAAVALGRLGGLTKTDKPRGFKSMGKKRRRAIAMLGVLARAERRKRQAVEVTAK